MTRSDDRPRQPKHSPHTQAEKAVREARLAEEMRQNLLKRKRQQRAQREAAKPTVVKPT
jgi:hypothetical protein